MEKPTNKANMLMVTNGTPSASRTRDLPLGGACYIHLTMGAYMKFIKVMLLWARPYFCTKKCVRVPHRVPNPCGIFCKLAILRFLSPFRAFPYISLRWSKPLGGDCSIQLSYRDILYLCYYTLFLKKVKK